jgi:hypothetical protein
VFAAPANDAAMAPEPNIPGAQPKSITAIDIVFELDQTMVGYAQTIFPRAFRWTRRITRMFQYLQALFRRPICPMSTT